MAQHYERYRSIAGDLAGIQPEDASALPVLLVAVIDGLTIQWLLDPRSFPGPRALQAAAMALADLAESVGPDLDPP